MNEKNTLQQERIDENMSVFQILSSYPFLTDIFSRNGLNKFENREVLEKLGPLLKLKTALTMVSINSDSFVEQLNKAVANQKLQDDFTLADSPERQNELTLLALLPCGMKMPFNRALDDFSEQYRQRNNSVLRTLVEGNVNHELSYYAYIDSITSIDELPDVIISSDINSFYHKSFRERFLNNHYFSSLAPDRINSDFDEIGFSDPENQFTMISANLLVIVSVNELMTGLKEPESWGDLLDESFQNKIAMRGQDGFFCNGVLLPFYQMFDMEGIEKLSRSVYTGLHPSEMVKMIDSGKSEVPPLYIMPYFFAQKIKEKSRVTISVPKEGAIISPVQMLVKKSAAEDVREITDFLCGKEFAEISAKAFFPTTHPEVKNNHPDINQFFWLGWDFLKNTDLGPLKEKMAEVFIQVFKATGGVL